MQRYKCPMLGFIIFALSRVWLIFVKVLLQCTLKSLLNISVILSSLGDYFLSDKADEKYCLHSLDYLFWCLSYTCFYKRIRRWVIYCTSMSCCQRKPYHSIWLCISIGTLIAVLLFITIAAKQRISSIGIKISYLFWV